MFPVQREGRFAVIETAVVPETRNMAPGAVGLSVHGKLAEVCIFMAI
jgi:hypothetical protein